MSGRWMRLDNAALIFPAVRRQEWNNVFRESVTLTEPVDPQLLQRAVEDLQPRFPSLFVRLRTGAFWYYLEEVAAPPKVRQDYAYPLAHMMTTQSSAVMEIFSPTFSKSPKTTSSAAG